MLRLCIWAAVRGCAAARVSVHGCVMESLSSPRLCTSTLLCTSLCTNGSVHVHRVCFTPSPRRCGHPQSPDVGQDVGAHCWLPEPWGWVGG